jgi:lipopolysaccharide/colanic/teichoic acid biosynthesis glycosyltransferase
MSDWPHSPAKRAVDLVGAAVLLVIVSPVMLGIALLLWCTGVRPVLFMQERPGLRGRRFRLVKFRTLVDAAPDAEDADPPPPVNRLAEGLRLTGLDELPELWNILTGDMSFVGPRPLLVRYLDRYTPEQARRHEVRPGLTGWAQVHGRNNLDWQHRFEMDVWYVDHATWKTDLHILLLTLKTLWTRTGGQPAGEFRGTDGG